MYNTVMNPQDAPSAKLAEAYVTIGSNRYNLFSAKNFEATDSVNTEEVNSIGRIRTGHKATGLEGSFSLTIYHVTAIFENLIKEFETTGVMPTFDLQVTSEDPATSIGIDTKIYTGCQIDGDIKLSDFDAEGDFREQEIEGFYESWETNSQYSNPSGM